MVEIESTCGRQNKCDSKPEICFRMVENSVGKGENAGYQHFLLVQQCFQKDTFSGSLKVVFVR